MDKASTRWRNTPIPPLHSHLAFLGVCYENSVQDRLCVEMWSLNLPGARPQLPFPTPPSDGPPEKRMRISAYAPPRQPPAPASKKQSTSRVIAALDAANILGCAAHPSFVIHDAVSLSSRSPPPSEPAYDPAADPNMSINDDSINADSGPGPSTRAKGKRKATD
jgi:hypothetical protein